MADTGSGSGVHIVQQSKRQGRQGVPAMQPSVKMPEQGYAFIAGRKVVPTLISPLNSFEMATRLNCRQDGLRNRRFALRAYAGIIV